jgi:hypothetical protein
MIPGGGVRLVAGPKAPGPSLIDWTARQQESEGWVLVYADRCR